MINKPRIQGDARLTYPLRLRFFLPILFLALLAPAFHFLEGVQAQGQQGLKMTVKAGLDGYSKETQWIPVHVTVENNGADLDARIQVSLSGLSGRPTVYGTDISLPAGSRKAVFLYVQPQRFLKELKVSLLDGKRSLLEEKLNIRTFSPQDITLYGVVTNDPSAYYILNNTAPLRGTARVAWLGLADLPDRAQGWGALDALVVADVDTGTFSPEQRDALGLWLAGGGRLFVVGNTNWQAVTAGLQEFLPVTLGSIQRVQNLSSLQMYVQNRDSLEFDMQLAVGQPKPGAEVLLEQDGLPLVVRQKIGFGESIYFAADPGMVPLRDWGGMPGFYEHLLNGPLQNPEWTRGEWQPASADRALGALSELSMPSVFLVCGWLIVYALVVGPLNYFVLKRMNRRELAWISIPLLVVLFSGSAYFTGGFLRGGRPILNRLAVVQSWDGVEQARVNGLVGVYSPNRAGYTLEANGNFLISPYEGDLAGYDTQLFLQQDKASFAPDMRVEIGGMQAVAVQGYVAAPHLSHDLVLMVSEKPLTLRGSITNQNDFPIQNAYLIFGNRTWKVGDLPSGKRVNVSFVYSSAYGYTGAIAGNDLGLNSYGFTDTPENARRRELLGASRTQADGLAPNSGIYLIGWADQPFLPMGLKHRGFAVVDTTMFTVMLSPKIEVEPGVIELSPPLLVWKASVEGISPYAIGYSPNGFEFQFKPAIPLRFSAVKSLTIHLDMGDGDLPLISCWNFEEGKWVQVENVRDGNTILQDAAGLTSPEGEVRLRVYTAPSQNWVEIDSLTVSLAVEP